MGRTFGDSQQSTNTRGCTICGQPATHMIRLSANLRRNKHGEATGGRVVRSRTRSYCEDHAVAIYDGAEAGVENAEQHERRA